MKLHLRTLLLAVLVAATPSAVASQQAKCGNTAAPEDHVETYRSTFVGADAAGWRAKHGIQTLSASDPAHVVTDDRICRRVMHEAMRIFRSWPHWRDVHRNGYEFQVYRFGPYYAVRQSDLPPAGVLWLTELSNLLVFRADTLDYLGTMSYMH